MAHTTSKTSKEKWQVADAIEYRDAEDGKIYTGVVAEAGYAGIRVKWDDGAPDTTFAFQDAARVSCIRRIA